MLVNDLKDEYFGSGFDSRHLHQSNTKEKMKRVKNAATQIPIVWEILKV